MPIDFEREEKHSPARYEVLRRWDMAGHEVVHAQARFLEEDGSLRDLERCLLCECDFDYAEETREDGSKVHVMQADPRKCGAKRAVAGSVRREVQERYGAAWAAMPLEEAIMDVFARHQAGEYLGTETPMLYIQDVIAILDRSPAPVPDGSGGMVTPIVDRGPDSVFETCFRLRDAERLDLTGWILIPFEPYLRLPHELYSFIRYMIEEPLGWPNGEAGDGFAAGLCAVMQEELGIGDGRELVGERNFPHLAADILLVAGLQWLLRGIADERLPEAKTEPVFRDEFAVLKDLESRLRALEGYDEAAARPIEGREPLLPPAAGAFSMPEELRALFLRLFVDAGTGPSEAAARLTRIEAALGASDGFGEAKEAFWPHNHPHVEPHLLRMYGVNFIALAIERAEKDAAARADVLRCPVGLIARSLDGLTDHVPGEAAADEE